MDLRYSASLPLHRRYLEKFFANVEEFSVSGFAPKIRRRELTPEVGLLKCLLKFKERKFKAMTILLDEADILLPPLLALLRNTIQEVRAYPHEFPVCLVLIGKEDLTQKLTGKWSPLRSFFAGHKHDLLALDYAGVKQAVVLVAKDIGVNWDEDAIEYTFQKSSGHPLIVQLFGDAAVSVSADGNIDMEDLRKAEKIVLDEV